MVVFKKKNDQFYISDGRVVAKRNGIKVPTTVTLYFEGEDNTFTMWPGSIEERPKCFQHSHSIYPNSVGGWSFNPESSFETVIYPYKDRIGICHNFVENFETIINFDNPVMIINSRKEECQVLLECSKGIWYLSGASKVAKAFGFRKPTSVILYFQFKDNRFHMIEKSAANTSNSAAAPANKSPLIILSDDSDEDDDKDEAEDEDEDEDEDDEDDDDDDNEQDEDCRLFFAANDFMVLDGNDDDVVADDEHPNRYNHFDVKITESMAYKNQVLHFPNLTSKHALRTSQKTIYIRDINTGRVINCKILTSSRYKYERYLGDGWYEFKDELQLTPGDVLKFSVEDPPHYLNVLVIRAA
ncbi:hypothetical protein L195_g010126 [Trifolium pratense]|uniref:TF-B3 domain-containing protein n=1 Tax=Trifolium pratense TaxID=57577 RepID=A0A2K3PDV7_TRIPR|nr:hypothetical protein L195_g010126 [Trifolium pratense]